MFLTSVASVILQGYSWSTITVTACFAEQRRHHRSIVARVFAAAKGKWPAVLGCCVRALARCACECARLYACILVRALVRARALARGSVFACERVGERLRLCARALSQSVHSSLVKRVTRGQPGEQSMLEYFYRIDVSSKRRSPHGYYVLYRRGTGVWQTANDASSWVTIGFGRALRGGGRDTVMGFRAGKQPGGPS